MAERTRRRAAASSSRRSRSDSGGSGEGRFNRDYSNEEYREPSEGYNGEQPTKGLYSCKLVNIEDHETAEGNESVKWTFELLPGSENKHGDDVSGWRDYQYTNDDTTAWREQQIAVALGLCKPKGKLTGTYAANLKKAKPCTVRVGTEQYIPEDGGDSETRGRMQAFMPLKDATGPAKRRSRRDEEEPEEDVFDDADDGDDDEDEPEEKPARRTSARSRRKAAEPEPEPDEEEEEGDEEPYDPDELAAELEDLTLVELKKRARDEFEITITRGMKADAIIDAILETLEDEDDEEDEPEPEPPPKRRRAASGKTATRKRGSTEDPPF